MIARISRGVELLLLVLVLGAGVAPITGCEEGPVEETGEEIDDALDDAGDELD